MRGAVFDGRQAGALRVNAPFVAAVPMVAIFTIFIFNHCFSTFSSLYFANINANL